MHQESSIEKGSCNLHRFIHRLFRPAKKECLHTPFLLAGMAGFEPTNAGVKVPCLTAWRHPNAYPCIIPQFLCFVNRFVSRKMDLAAFLPFFFRKNRRGLTSKRICGIMDTGKSACQAILNNPAFKSFHKFFVSVTDFSCISCHIGWILFAYPTKQERR